MVDAPIANNPGCERKPGQGTELSARHRYTNHGKQKPPAGRIYDINLIIATPLIITQYDKILCVTR